MLHECTVPNSPCLPGENTQSNNCMHSSFCGHHLEPENVMQRRRRLSVLFDCPDELEWINVIEVKAWKSSLWDMFVLHVVNVALLPGINIDPQLKFLRENWKSLVVPGICARAVVIRKVLKTPSSSIDSKSRAVILDNADVHPVRVSDCYVRTPRCGTWLDKRIRVRANNSEAWIK